ncbi:MAG TPA: MGMT family protein [Mycobacteriales bacterium]|nr:MGMT family protein [Mycobacteriales bacterium]
MTLPPRPPAKRTRPPESASAGLGGGFRTGAGPSAFSALVLDAVQKIPRGKVMTYGDVAEYVGYPRRARMVGQVMANHGHEVAWWRVLLSTGAPAPGHELEALTRLRKEKTPLRPDGERVDLRRARWDGS